MGKSALAVLGSDSAKRGGVLYLNLENEPEKLNPINDAEGVTLKVQEWVTEPLLRFDPETYELIPALADKYEISKDSLIYTFHLRSGALFSDGSPVTAEDVKFTFEYANNPAFNAPMRKTYVENVDRVETPDAQTIRVFMKKKYYKNLESLGNILQIVPKKVYGDPTKPINRTMVGSGPYKVASYEKGKSIELVRNDNWWGYKNPTPDAKNQGKFDKIVFRFIREENLQLEMVKKGQIDLLERVQPDAFVKKAVGEPYGTKVIKHKEVNQDPINKSFGFVAWNLRHPLFKDRDVRVALAELMNRQLMNEKFRYNMSDLAAGPSWNGNEDIVDPSVKPLPFDPKHAAALLKKAGWEDKDNKGVLQKSIAGVKTEFRFTILLAIREAEKYFTVYKEDLKKAGIDMEIKVVEWNTFMKLANEQKFEAITMSWSLGSLEPDLKQVFHSESAGINGSNYGGYSNKEVDQLIDQVREELDHDKRRKMWHKIYRLIAEDAPYVFTFATKYDLYLAQSRIGMTKGTLKYDRGTAWWWSIGP